MLIIDDVSLLSSYTPPCLAHCQQHSSAKITVRLKYYHKPILPMNLSTKVYSIVSKKYREKRLPLFRLPDFSGEEQSFAKNFNIRNKNEESFKGTQD
jgi:hypothetical protein